MSTHRFHRPLRAIRTEYAGRVYDSRMEASRAATLDLLVRAGQVAWWIPQVQVQLGPDDRFRVDFLVAEPWGTTGGVKVHAEDVKAIETREFARHRRMWRKYGPVPLHIIKRKTVEVVERET